MAMKALLWRSSRLASLRAMAPRNVAGFSTAAGDSDSGPVFDNRNAVMTLVDKGRMMRVRFQDQKEFEMFLERANAIGVTQPEHPGIITGRLCEMDPARLHVLVDQKMVLRATKKIAKEKAEQQNVPTEGIMKFMNKNYETDSDED